MEDDIATRLRFNRRIAHAERTTQNGRLSDQREIESAEIALHYGLCLQEAAEKVLSFISPSSLPKMLHLAGYRRMRGLVSLGDMEGGRSRSDHRWGCSLSSRLQVNGKKRAEVPFRRDADDKTGNSSRG